MTNYDLEEQLTDAIEQVIRPYIDAIPPECDSHGRLYVRPDEDHCFACSDDGFSGELGHVAADTVAIEAMHECMKVLEAKQALVDEYVKATDAVLDRMEHDRDAQQDLIRNLQEALQGETQRAEHYMAHVGHESELQDRIAALELELSETGRTGHQAVEAECLHMVLDNRGVPRATPDGITYSLVGRFMQTEKPC